MCVQKEPDARTVEFFEIGLKGDHALRCTGKMGLRMRHDAVKFLVARAFEQAGFEVSLEQGGGLLDGRRPGDVKVEDWVVVNNWIDNTSLCIDVAIIDATGDAHSEALRSKGVGEAATQYEKRKRKTYCDIKGKFIPFVLEAQRDNGVLVVLRENLSESLRNEESRDNVYLLLVALIVLNRWPI